MNIGALWEQASQLMDETVDNVLGDVIAYKRAGEDVFTDLPGFVVFETANLDLGEIDETQETAKRIKIGKHLIDGPRVTDRLRCPAKLGASTFRPLGKLPVSQGRYWIFDIQEVQA